MLSLEFYIACVMLISLIIYMLTGGADFGGGVWDLFATGPRAKAQRSLITQAIAPIWEANHVWLIVIVVLLFVAFPVAFAAMSTALHIPLTLMLIGIVLRGSAFIFRTYDDQSDTTHRRWSRVFAVASVITPVMLGVTLGAVASGTIHVNVESGQVETDFVSAWFAPFPFAIGFFTLTLCALLAAVYLTLETEDPALRADFRQRALIAAVSVGAMAGLSFVLSTDGAPAIRRGLGSAPWSIPFQILTGAVALWAIWTIWKRQFRLARILVPIQVTLIVFGWGLAQYPYLVTPDLTFSNTAAPDAVLRPLLIILGVGGILLVPAFWYLYAVFKGTSRKTKSVALQIDTSQKD
jgi:cytochrome d ubiquinol oxidase subunit II